MPQRGTLYLVDNSGVKAALYAQTLTSVDNDG
jgi:hypothetical protein